MVINRLAVRGEREEKNILMMKKKKLFKNFSLPLFPKEGWQKKQRRSLKPEND
jgi:hypothetical protein